MIESKFKVEREKLLIVDTFKKRLGVLERDLKRKNDDLDRTMESLFNAEKKAKVLENQRQKMKDRIMKLKTSRRMDLASKTCRLCTKDFNDKENFNWSCRTHRSEYSGEMWWCCGKTNKDALGCKYQKHESKEEEDEDEEMEGYTMQDLSKLRCTCCREKGHIIDQCPRDPNLKTKADTELDSERILRIKDFKKLFSDTAVQTTHLLKRCVVVQERASRNQKKVYNTNPFKRGAMTFDDYNYQIYNPYILVEDAEKTDVLDAKKATQFITHQDLEKAVSEVYEHSSLYSGLSPRGSLLNVLEKNEEAANDDEGRKDEEQQVNTDSEDNTKDEIEAGEDDVRVYF